MTGLNAIFMLVRSHVLPPSSQALFTTLQSSNPHLEVWWAFQILHIQSQTSGLTHLFLTFMISVRDSYWICRNIYIYSPFRIYMNLNLCKTPGITTVISFSLDAGWNFLMGLLACLPAPSSVYSQDCSQNVLITTWIRLNLPSVQNTPCSTFHL